MSRTLLLSAIVALGCSVSSVPAASDIEKAIVQSIMLNQIGLLVDDPNMIFGIINLESEQCYCVAPPEGATLIVGDEYSFVPDTTVAPILQRELSRQYPNCKIVRVRR